MYTVPTIITPLLSPHYYHPSPHYYHPSPPITPLLSPPSPHYYHPTIITPLLSPITPLLSPHYYHPSPHYYHPSPHYYHPTIITHHPTIITPLLSRCLTCNSYEVLIQKLTLDCNPAWSVSARELRSQSRECSGGPVASVGPSATPQGGGCRVPVCVCVWCVVCGVCVCVCGVCACVCVRVGCVCVHMVSNRVFLSTHSYSQSHIYLLF